MTDISPVRPDEYPRALELWEASVRATHHFVSDAGIEFFRPLVKDELPQVEQLAGVREDDVLLGFAGVVDGKLEMLFLEVAGRSELDGLGKPYPLLHLRLVPRELG